MADKIEVIEETIEIPTLTAGLVSTMVGETNEERGPNKISIPSISGSGIVSVVGRTKYSTHRYIMLPTLNPEATEVPGYRTLDKEVSRLLPGLFDFYIKQGSVWEQDIYWLDENGAAVDLTSFSADMVIKKTADSSSDEIILSSNPEEGDGTITLGGGNGTIKLSLTAVLTAGLSFDRAVYDLRMTDGDDEIHTILEGMIYLIKGVMESA
jgi:hypothetical protein